MVPPPAPPHSGGASVSNPAPPKRLVARATPATRSGLAVAFPCRTDDRESPANDRRPLTTSNGCGGRVDSTRISDARFRIRPTFSRHGSATEGSERSPWRLLLSVIALAFGLATPLPAQSAAPRVALVLDQEAPSLEPQVAAFEREIQGFFRPGEITLLAPQAGDGTAAGVSRALDRALSDSSVAAVVALGPIGSHLLAHAGEPRKPAIAATIVDASWQGIPQKDGASGVQNLAYVDEVVRVERNGRRLPPDDPVPPDGGPARPRAAGGDPRARGQRPLSRPLRRRRGRRGIPARGTADQILAALPADADAVYLTPYPALGEAETARLIAGLERAAAAHAEPHGRRRARGRAGVLRAARALAAPRPPGGGGPPADPGRRGCRLAAGAAGRRPAAHPQPRHRPDDRVLARLQHPHGRGAGRHRLARPGGHRLAGGCDARRRRGQSRSQGRGPRGGIGRAGRAARPLQPAPARREPVRRHGDAGGGGRVAAWGSSPSGSSTAGSPSLCRSTRSRHGPATARSSICRRAAKLSASRPGSTSCSTRPRRTSACSRPARWPRCGGRTCTATAPTSRRRGSARAWGAPAAPTSTAGRARWPTRGGT